MCLKRFRWLAILALLFASGAKADSLNTVYIDGSYSFSINGLGIPPYGGTLNGQSASFYCVDFSSPIKAGDAWNVNITNLSGSNFSLTRLNNKTSYSEMAWLVTQMMGAPNQLQKAEYQYAIWSFTGGPDPSQLCSTCGTINKNLLTAALLATQNGFTGNGFEILTPTPTGSKGQEFLIHVPEPEELLMFVIGLFVLGVATRKGRVARAHAT